MDCTMPLELMLLLSFKRWMLENNDSFFNFHFELVRQIYNEHKNKEAAKNGQNIQAAHLASLK
jgi:hypothetical protein